VSDVQAGAVMTLVIPLSLVVVVLALWGLHQWRLLERRRAGASSEGSGVKDGSDTTAA
jgi:hypothetical protein